jgi:hypothetical protein|tara:strand:+ start:300 stop:515 length:216 start_codon:yes stop_codon:yes gene_type:complete
MTNGKYKIYGLKVYTKTVMDGKIPKMYGVIEGEVNKMMNAYPDKFSFMKHQTTRSLRPSKKSPKAAETKTP